MKKYFHFLLLFIVSISALPAFSQQDAQFSQYMYNPLYFNPASAGLDGVARFQLHYRNQWTGYQTTSDGSGSLGTQLFTASMPLKGLNSGLGIAFTNDKSPSGAGYQDIQLSYSYQAHIADAILSIGVRGGLHTESFDTRFRPREPGDPIVDGLSTKINETHPDFALGIQYQASNYYFGAAYNHLNKPNYTFGYAKASNIAQPTLYLNAGYHYYVTNEVELTPMALYRTDFTQNSLQATLNGTYLDKYFIGGGYRLNDAAIILLGMHFLPNNALRLSYSLDLTTNALTAKSPTSHELLLSYSIPAPKLFGGKKTPVRTPRFRR
ncbi:MAG: type IX secretion system membrane protein PorP/SprF [Spirosomataceae bacterium]